MSSLSVWQRVRQMPERLPLRTKLIAAVLSLVAVALAIISLVGLGILRNYLLSGVDQTLGQQVNQVVFQLHQGISLDSPPSNAVGQAVTWVPNEGAQHKVVVPVTAIGLAPGQGEKELPGPAVPADAASLPSNPNSAVTLGSTSGNDRWRVVGIAATAHDNGTVVHGTIVVATDASSVYRTIGGLAGIDLIVSIALILLIAAVGAAVIRANLKPLRDIERTAGAIAAGDLTRRVPEEDPRTEVGSLGRSLNIMLGQIETAFDGRSQSEAAARESEKRMRRFMDDAGHELRTPLASIRGFAEYYRFRGGIADSPVSDAPIPQAVLDDAAAVLGRNGADKLSAADLDRIMRRVEQESARMGVLIEDMLLLARMDQQRPLDRSTVDLLALATDAVHDARVVAPERSINLTVGSGAALFVTGDEVRLRQVIGNLMSNALAHTPADTPIDVRIRSGSLAEVRVTDTMPELSFAVGVNAAKAADQPAAILEVTDHGLGLTKEQAEHVFERFYQANKARTPGGTGLGLAIVTALVAAHNGAVWVQSKPGDGATFSIALPLAPEALEGSDDEAVEPDEEHQPESTQDAAGDDDAPWHNAA